MVFQPNNNENPKGRPPGRQSFVDRARYLMENHTIESVQELACDTKKFNKLSVYDGMIVRRIFEAIMADGDKSMNSLLDRLLGKPSQHIKQEIDQTVTVSYEERKKAAEDEANEMHRIAASKMKKPEHSLVH